MFTILIDSSDRYKKSVTLFKDKKEIDKIVGDLDITVSIRDLLKRNNLKVSDINEFNVNPGPGSFTGLKIGVTIANILNWALGKKNSSELTYPEYGGAPNIHKTKWLEK